MDITTPDHRMIENSTKRRSDQVSARVQGEQRSCQHLSILICSNLRFPQMYKGPFAGLRQASAQYLKAVVIEGNLDNSSLIFLDVNLFTT